MGAVGGVVLPLDVLVPGRAVPHRVCAAGFPALLYRSRWRLAALRRGGVSEVRQWARVFSGGCVVLAVAIMAFYLLLIIYPSYASGLYRHSGAEIWGGKFAVPL